MHKTGCRQEHGGTTLTGPLPSYKFFKNPSCEFFPCHEAEDEDSFNCLFCYCPLYAGECPGEPEIRAINGNMVKDCTCCGFPHHADNYEDIIRCLIERIS